LSPKYFSSSSFTTKTTFTSRSAMSILKTCC